jgi:hypothetical protein
MDEGKGHLEPDGSAVSERQKTRFPPFGASYVSGCPRPRKESWKTTLHSFGLKETKATREQRLKKEKEDKLKKTKNDDEKGSVS